MEATTQPGRVILVSNRLPVTVRVDRGELLASSTGGVATGLRGVHERSGGTWVGWPGDVSRLNANQREGVDRKLTELACVPVHLSASEISRYYDGFSNGVLWPLFHYQLDRVPPTSHEWDVYRSVNQRFADATARAWKGPQDLVWVHDYQLLLVPRMLRALVPEARIGFFLHIPFPAYDVMRILPWRDEILAGMLGADLLGFHTFPYRSHFASSVLRILGLAVHGDDIDVDDRNVRLGVFPMGVDAPGFGALATADDVEADVCRVRQELRGEKVLLGLDRLDYTKGIPRRLLAFERLLEREPRWRGRVRLLQIAPASREKVPSYKEFRAEVDELVGHINGTFSTIDWVPIRYVHRPQNQRQIAALYRAADVMLVTPLRDGMNLVAKEFVACRTDEDGVLILSELAGASAEMVEAVQVNPYDIDALARTYHDALTMGEDERRQRMRALRQRVFAWDVHRWASSFLETLGSTSVQPRPQVTLSSRAELDELAQRMRAADQLLLLLDYDGTLVPFTRTPDLAGPDRNLRELLGALAAKPGVNVHVISGRRRETLDRWLGELPIGLHAEHGYWSRPNQRSGWNAVEDVSVEWMAGARTVLDAMTAVTPGSLLEVKTTSLAWHWRMAEPEIGAARATELARRLQQVTEGQPVRIVPGDKVLEICARGVGKDRVVEQLLRNGAHPLPMTAAMGDDVTDDDLFRALPPGGISISVGFRPSAARYRVDHPRAARALLQRLVAPKT
jgi:trehalose 6-phosphate synthase/phosphatase